MGSVKLTRSASFDDLSNTKLSSDNLISKDGIKETSFSDISSLESEDELDEDDIEHEEEEKEEEKYDEEFVDAEENNNDKKSTNSRFSNRFGTDNNRGLPSSCIFVASLAATLSDDKLCLSVKDKFKEYGELNGVKVLRDQENRPYAFVQYTNDIDASVALEKAHGSILDGRVIRCEPARVNRTLFITNPHPISYVEIKQLCLSFGKLEQLVPNRDKNQFSQRYAYPVTVSSSWFVRFVYRDDAIRAFANLKTEACWTVQWAQNVNVPKKFNLLLISENNSEQDLPNNQDRYHNNDDSSSHTTNTNPRMAENTNNVTIDKKSIFVGQLPKESTTENIKEHFSKYGKIIEVNLIHKPTNVFTFIQYETEKAAAAALEKENHSIFLDKTIHVQYKELGGYHGKRAYRRNSDILNNNTRMNHFSGPQLNLAPPPISMYRRRSYDVSNNAYGNPNLNIGNKSPNSMLPFLHYFPPNISQNSIPNFDANMYSYMNGNPPHNLRRGTLPDNWTVSRGENINAESNSNTNRNKRSNSKKQDNENTIGTTDTVTDVASDLTDSPGRADGTRVGVNSTTTYNNSSAGSISNDYKNKIDKIAYNKSNNGSNESINYNESINPYFFQHYYYPPVPYTMGPPHSPQGSMHNHPYMMLYSLPPQGVPLSDGSMIPVNFPMSVNPDGSGPDSPNGYPSFSQSPQVHKEKEFLDY